MAEVAVAGLAGVLSHIYVFVHGEWHRQATKILYFYFSLFAAVTAFKVIYYYDPWLQALTWASKICNAYAFGLYASLISYRLFFHRLHAFPGPVLARISKFWHVGQCLDSKNYLLVQELRKRYGDFVRTGMRDQKLYSHNDADPLQDHASLPSLTRTYFQSSSRVPITPAANPHGMTTCSRILG